MQVIFSGHIRTLCELAESRNGVSVQFDHNWTFFDFDSEEDRQSFLEVVKKTFLVDLEPDCIRFEGKYCVSFEPEKIQTARIA